MSSGAVDPRTSSLSDARAPRGMTSSALLLDAALGRCATAGRAPTPGRGPVRTRASATSSSASDCLDDASLLSAKLIYASSPAMEHTREGHPESNLRVPAILDALAAANLTPEARAGELVRLDAFAPATREQVMEVHTKNYVGGLNVLAKTRAPMDVTGDTYITSASYDAALRGCGAAIALVDAVCDAAEARESRQPGSSLAPAAFGLCRPPGHHATPKSAMGFCLFGTVAAAARHAQRARGMARVMIFDFDVHHGNGTNDIFRDDPSVLFVSTHEDGSFPGTGKMSDAGEGEGVGATINVPLPPGSGDAAALAAFDDVVAPAAVRFSPDIVLVSAGYDAHWRDPLAGLSFRTGTYWRLSARVKALADELCGGRCVFLLEGGYDLTGLGEGVADSFRALLGDGSGEDPGAIAGLTDEPTEKVRRVLAEAKAMHQL